ncbi:MAG: POTRA domain-containing protein [Pseudomonadota bacterium]
MGHIRTGGRAGLLLLCFLILAHTAAGEEKPFDMSAMEDMKGKTISSIVFEPSLGIENPMKFFDLKADAVISQALIHKIITKAWNTGRVAEVSVFAEPDAAGGAMLIIKATLRMHLHDMDFDGNKHIKGDELKDVSGFRPDMEIFDDTIEKIRKLILERYALRGFPYADVDIETEKMEEPDKVKLKVEISEGKAIKIWNAAFTGRPVFSPLKIRKITKIKSGDVYDQVKINEGIEALKDELRKIGFYNCRIDPPSLILDEKRRLMVEISVDPGPNFEVLFVGNHHVSHDTILKVLELDKQQEISLAVLEELAFNLEEYYRKLGFSMVSAAAAMLVKDKGEEGTILFKIDEGKRIEVKKIAFAGNKHFSAKQLRKQVISILNKNIEYKVLFVEPSFEVINELGISGDMPEPAEKAYERTAALAPWPPKKIFLKESYEEAAKHISELYAAEGFLDAEVKEPAIEINAKGDSMTVTIVIDEGVRTWIESIELEGVLEARKKKLLKAAGIRKGEPYNGMAVKEAEGNILNIFQDWGFMFATVTSDVRFSEDGEKATITYSVEEGPLVHVEDVVVRGNVSTKKSLITDRITLKPGKVFTLDKQKKSSAFLRELGIFNSVVISMEEPALVAGKKRAVVQVTEKKSQFLELRAGASSGEGLRGGMEYGYRNLFGAAIDFGFLAHFNYRFFFVGVGKYFPEWYMNELSLAEQLERNISVRFGIPHVPKIGRWLTIQTSFAHQRKNSNLYGLTQNSVYASFLISPLSYLHFNVRFGFEDSDVGTNTVAEKAMSKEIQDLPVCSDIVKEDCLSQEENRALRVPVGKTAFTVLGTDFTLDLRDNAFNPTKGMRLSMGVSWIRSTDPAEQTHKIYADNDEYKSWKTWSLSNLLRNTISIAGYIPLGTRKVVLMLYAATGFIFQLQDDSETFADRLFYLGGGHTIRGFPEESLCAYESPPGLCAYGGNLMVNYRVELSFPIYKELGGAVFSDMGNLWRELDNFSFTDLKATIGVGIRYATPIGPLNLSYGIIINRDESRGEPFGALHFSIGTI